VDVQVWFSETNYSLDTTVFANMKRYRHLDINKTNWHVRSIYKTLTHKSVAAREVRERHASLDGGWSADTLERASGTVASPKNAATDRRMFKADTNESSWRVASVSAAAKGDSVGVSWSSDLESFAGGIGALFIGVTSLRGGWSDGTCGWFLGASGGL